MFPPCSRGTSCSYLLALLLLSQLLSVHSYLLDVSRTIEAGATTQVVANLSGTGEGQNLDPWISVGDDELKFYRLFWAAAKDCPSETPVQECQALAPVCILEDCLSIEVRNLTVVVPPSVGPSGDYYHLAYKMSSKPLPAGYPMNNRDDSISESGFGYSNTWWMSSTLEGGTAGFSAFELNGEDRMWEYAELVPCEMFDCARTCAMEHLEGKRTFGGQITEEMQACLGECQGYRTEPNACVTEDTGTGIVDLGLERASSSSIAATSSTVGPSATETGSAIQDGNGGVMYEPRFRWAVAVMLVTSTVVALNFI